MKPAAAKARIRFDNILYATDFSATAKNAIPFVKTIATHFNSNILAFHVKPPIVNPMTEPATWPPLVEAAKAVEKEHRLELREAFDGFNAEVEIDEGDIGSNLEKTIRAHNTDLIVIGTHGRTGIAKILLGSIAEEIFRTVSCPVLTVGPHSDPAKSNVRKILFATDFSSEAPAAAAYAISLAQEFQAGLTMEHVIPESKPGELQFWSEMQQSAKKRLHELLPVDAEVWCKPEYFVERGEPADRILDLANLQNVDLIVLGVRPEAGVPGAATHLGIATAHRVVVRAKCPVLTIRSEQQ
jgi:nucleotide-binding universal stress UspA family protein